MEIFGKLKMSMGHISCTWSGHLEKERSNRGTEDRRDIFKGDQENDGMSAYRMTRTGGSGQRSPTA